MTTLKFGGFWDRTGSISWNLVVCKKKLLNYRYSCKQECPDGPICLNCLKTFQRVSKLFRYFQMISKVSRQFQNGSNISRWSWKFPDSLKTVRTFPDDFKIFHTNSKLFRYFQMVLKLSGRFQVCPDFSGWLQNLPDVFKTIWISPIGLKTPRSVVPLAIFLQKQELQNANGSFLPDISFSHTSI